MVSRCPVPARPFRCGSVAGTTITVATGLCIVYFPIFVELTIVGGGVKMVAMPIPVMGLTTVSGAGVMTVVTSVPSEAVVTKVTNGSSSTVETSGVWKNVPVSEVTNVWGASVRTVVTSVPSIAVINVNGCISNTLENSGL